MTIGKLFGVSVPWLSYLQRWLAVVIQTEETCPKDQLAAPEGKTGDEGEENEFTRKLWRTEQQSQSRCENPLALFDGRLGRGWP